VRASTDGTAMNAAEADLVFNPAALMVTKISTEDSVLALWPTPPEYSNVRGTIRFSGTATESFNGEGGELITIRFMALGSLPGDVRIESGAILINDARATNIISTMQSALYTVNPRAVSAPVSVPATSTDVIASTTPTVAGVSTEIPVITQFSDTVTVGERIILQGTAAPNSDIVVLLQFQDEAPTESIVPTTKNGTFTYVSLTPAQSGTYRAWANIRTQSDVASSEVVVFSANSHGVSIGVAAAASIAVYLMPYLALLLLLGAVIGYIYYRRTRSS
jgi:hypothetical protein